MVWIWLFYFVGQVLHFLLKAQAVASSKKNTAINSLREYFAAYGVVLVARFFAATCIFVLCVFGGEALGVNFLPALKTLPAPVAAALSGLIGLAIDSILDKAVAKVEWLQGQVPQEPTTEKVEEETT